MALSPFWWTWNIRGIFEVFTWNQIGLLQKPCAIFNMERYFDLLISFFDHMQNEQFLKAQYREALIVDEDAAALLDKCEALFLQL